MRLKGISEKSNKKALVSNLGGLTSAALHDNHMDCFIILHHNGGKMQIKYFMWLTDANKSGNPTRKEHMEVVKINNTDLQIKEYNMRRVITFKDIDECHNRSEGTARKRFNENKERFIEGVDYFKISPSEFRTAIGEMDKRQQNKITLITESGYMMLVKSFTDDLAWEVQRMLVNIYFQKHEDNRTEADKLLVAQSKVMNAKARLASVWLKLADRVPNNQTYQQICNSYASEVLTGTKVLPLPECDERYYTATEIAEMIGTTSNMVGRKSKAAGIKPADENTYSEYGKWFFDKSAHSSKQVSTFKYNARGVEAVKTLFNQATVLA